MRGATWSERENVGRGDVRGPPGRQQVMEVTEDRAGVLDVLDRLQKHDRLAGALIAVTLDRGALEAQVRAPVAQPRVLMGLGVGVDAHHASRTMGQHIGPVALAAGHVKYPQPVHPRSDPLVHREMAAIPVILRGNVWQGALARKLERGNTRRLILLVVGLRRHPDQPSAAKHRVASRDRVECRGSWWWCGARRRFATSTPAITTGLQPPTMPSGASTSDRSGRHRCAARVATHSVDGRRAIRSRSRSALGPVTSASTCCVPEWCGRPPALTSLKAWWRCWPRTRRSSV